MTSAAAFFEPAPAAAALPLRDYQQEAVEAVEQAWREGMHRPLVSLPTGTGKTVIFAHLLQRRGGRALVLVHREELLQQALEKIRIVAPQLDSGLVRARADDHRAQVVVATVQTLGRTRQLSKLTRDFRTLIVDECFPAGTRVGERPIENIRVGESVPSYDETSETFVSRQVTRVMSRRPKGALLQLWFSNGSVLCCTPNHPILTDSGWLAAAQLQEASDAHFRSGDLCLVWNARNPHRAEPDQGLSTIGTSVLLSRASRPLGVEGLVGTHGENEPSACLATNEGSEPDALAGDTRQDVPLASSHRASASSSGRQRSRTVTSTADLSVSVGLADGSRDPHGPASTPRNPNLLQTRHRGSRVKDGHRGGRDFTQLGALEGARCPEDGTPEWARLVRVEIHEPGSDGRYGGLCRDGLVYNLEVDGTHTYLAESIVVHNCHHAVPGSAYEYVLDELQTAGANAAGVTATPERADRKRLGDLWEKVVYHRDILTMIKAEYLSPLRGVRVVLKELDLGRVHTRHGDFVDNEAEQALFDADAPVHAVRAYQQHALGRKALVFTSGVRLAHSMAETFRKQGVPAAAVDGSTPAQERARMLQDFREGRIQVLANCQVLTEGYDEPSVDCILMARPTQSHPLYVQMVGRGTRRHPGKRDCLVIDLVGNSALHDAITLIDLFPPEPKTQKPVNRLTLVEDGDEGDDQQEIVDGALLSAEIDLFQSRPLAWASARGLHVLGAGDVSFAAFSAGTEQWQVWRLEKGKPADRLFEGLSLEYAQGTAEDLVRQEGGLALARPKARWRKQPPSTAQIAGLARLGVPIDDIESKGDASDRMSLALASMRLRAALNRQESGR